MTNWIERLQLHFGDYLEPRPATRVGTCEASLRFKLPEDYKTFLLKHDGGVVFLEPGRHPDNGGLHLFGCDDIVRQTRIFKEYKPLPGHIIFASTPGAGAYFLALNKAGQVVDTGSHHHSIIAESAQQLIDRMFSQRDSGAKHPYYWF